MHLFAFLTYIYAPLYCSFAEKERPPNGWSFLFLCGHRTRTHLHATCRWQVAATSANTGGYNNFRLRRKCKSSPISSIAPEGLRIPTSLTRLAMTEEKPGRCGRRPLQRMEFGSPMRAGEEKSLHRGRGCAIIRKNFPGRVL